WEMIREASRFPFHDPLDGPPEITSGTCPNCYADEVYLGDEARLVTRTGDWACGVCEASGPYSMLGLAPAAAAAPAQVVEAILHDEPEPALPTTGGADD